MLKIFLQADALALKSAMSSAFDVMNSLENSVSGLLPKVLQNLLES